MPSRVDSRISNIRFILRVPHKQNMNKSDGRGQLYFSWFNVDINVYLDRCIFVELKFKMISDKWTYKMIVGYILSSVCVRLSIFSQLSIIQYIGMCIFILPISLVIIERVLFCCPTQLNKQSWNSLPDEYSICLGDKGIVDFVVTYFLHCPRLSHGKMADLSVRYK